MLHDVSKKAELIKVLRQDLSSFIKKSFAVTNPGTPYLHNWHIDLIAEYLRACEQGDITRLIINVPPRSLKSHCVTVSWPAWLLGHDPAQRIIAASYAQSLSLKHSLDCRLIMQSPWYGEVFPMTELVAGQNEKHKFVTTKRGSRLATSVGGTVTGEGGNILIVDDPHNPTHIHSVTRRKAALQWFDQTFSSRLDDKQQGVFVIVMQRLHEEDLTGHLLAKTGWQHLCLPAYVETPTVIDFAGIHKERQVGDILHVARENQTLLHQAKRELGSYGFAAQYLQNPVPAQGSMIQPRWLRYYQSMPLESIRIIQSWDTAIKAGDSNDYSVCTVWAEYANGYYLQYVYRKRMEYPELKHTVIKLAEEYQPDAILMEDKASGQSLLQDLRRETTLPLIAIMPMRDKVTRMAAVSPLLEAGKVWLPKRVAWLGDYRDELLRFPSGSHDDQVDSTSQFLHWIKHRKQQELGIRML